MIQATHGGSNNIRTVVDLWGQYASYSQHTTARVQIEEKVEFNLLPCYLGIFGNEIKYDGSCAISGQPGKHLYESCFKWSKAEVYY